MSVGGGPSGAVLITGGAGYIGSHVLRLLRQRGDDVVVVDDLSTGHRDRVPEDVPFHELDLAAPSGAARVEQILRAHGVRSVMHFAAGKHVGDSVVQPTDYMRQNVGGLTNLLLGMERAGVRELVFSSSAAVYGEPDDAVIAEDTACHPVNPYGQTKLIGEWMTQNAQRAWGLRAVNLRYFNVGGAGWPDLRDREAQNLVPIVIDAVRGGRAPRIFGGDHPTPDGSCVRDYIHVMDLAVAHIEALRFVGTQAADACVLEFNLGTGRGASVREVIDIVAAASGQVVHADVVERRAGDPAAVVADPTRAEVVLGWTAALDITDIVRSAWEAAAVDAEMSLV